MNQEKQCAKCKKRFDSNLRYCPKCGTYWKQGTQNQEWTGGILSAEQSEEIVAPGKQQREETRRETPFLPARYIICERCKKEIPVEGDMRPDFCCYCKTIVDGFAEIKERQPAAASPDNQQTTAEEEERGFATKPSRLPKRNLLNRKAPPPPPDDSTIAFVWLRSGESRRLSEPNVDGAILLGTKGNYETEFFSSPEFHGVEERQAAIVHELNGWYMAVEGPNLRLNNAPLSLDTSHPLKNNDRINLGDCTLQVEILARAK